MEDKASAFCIALSNAKIKQLFPECRELCEQIEELEALKQEVAEIMKRIDDGIKQDEVTEGLKKADNSIKHPSSTLSKDSIRT